MCVYLVWMMLGEPHFSYSDIVSHFFPLLYRINRLHLDECILRKICYLLDVMQRKAKYIVKCTSSSCFMLVAPSIYPHSFSLGFFLSHFSALFKLLLFFSTLFFFCFLLLFTVNTYSRSCSIFQSLLLSFQKVFFTAQNPLIIKRSIEANQHSANIYSCSTQTNRNRLDTYIFCIH